MECGARRQRSMPKVGELTCLLTFVGVMLTTVDGVEHVTADSICSAPTNYPKLVTAATSSCSSTVPKFLHNASQALFAAWLSCRTLHASPCLCSCAFVHSARVCLVVAALARSQLKNVACLRLGCLALPDLSKSLADRIPRCCAVLESTSQHSQLAHRSQNVWSRGFFWLPLLDPAGVVVAAAQFPTPVSGADAASCVRFLLFCFLSRFFCLEASFCGLSGCLASCRFRSLLLCCFFSHGPCLGRSFCIFSGCHSCFLQAHSFIHSFMHSYTARFSMSAKHQGFRTLKKVSDGRECLERKSTTL